jgi:hypothetical protein
VVRGLKQLSEVGWESDQGETIGHVEVEIFQEPTKHVVDVPKLLKWMETKTGYRSQDARKEKLRKILGMKELNFRKSELTRAINSKCQKQSSNGCCSNISMVSSLPYRNPSKRSNSRRKRDRNIRSESGKRLGSVCFDSDPSRRGGGKSGQVSLRPYTAGRLRYHKTEKGALEVGKALLASPPEELRRRCSTQHLVHI